MERQWKWVMFQLVFTKNGRQILHPKLEKYTHPDCHQQKMQNPALVMVLRSISVHGLDDILCIGILKRHKLLSRQCVFAYFSSTLPGLILHMPQQSRSGGRIRQRWSWSAEVLNPAKMDMDSCGTRIYPSIKLDLTFTVPLVQSFLTGL